MVTGGHYEKTTASPCHETKLDRRQTTDSTNYREDVNTNGQIDRGDFAVVKAQLGTMLPP